MKKLIATLLFLAMAFPAFGADFDLVLQWDENTEPDLATGEKARYKIYYRIGESLNGDKTAADVVLPVKVSNDENLDAALVQYTVGNLDDQKVYYFAVTALDESQNESGLSNEVHTTIVDHTPPGVPKNLTWFEKIIAFLKSLFNRG